MDISDLCPSLLVQTPKNEVLRVSTIYPDRVTAQVVYPVPGRTAVRTYRRAEVASWNQPTSALLARYEIAWGYR